MPKTFANPDRLLQRAQRYIVHLEAKLGSLARVLETLQTAIKQGDVAEEHREDVLSQLRWVQHQLDHELPTRLGMVRLRAGDICELLEPGNVICPPEVFPPPQEPPGDQNLIAQPQ